MGHEHPAEGVKNASAGQIFFEAVKKCKGLSDREGSGLSATTDFLLNTQLLVLAGFVIILMIEQVGNFF